MEFIDKPDPNAKYDAGSLEIFSADGRLSSWKIAKPQGGMVAIYSPERKVAGKIAVQQFNEIAEFLESKPSTKK